MNGFLNGLIDYIAVQGNAIVSLKMGSAVTPNGLPSFANDFSIPEDRCAVLSADGDFFSIASNVLYQLGAYDADTNPNAPSDFTICCRFNPDPSLDLTTAPTFVSKTNPGGDPDPCNFFLEVDNNDNSKFLATATLEDSVDNYLYFSAQNNGGGISKGLWGQLGLTYKYSTGDAMPFWNGIPFPSGVPPTKPVNPIQSDSSPLIYGAWGGGGFQFIGKLADLRMWSRVLTDQEMLDQLDLPFSQFDSGITPPVQVPGGKPWMTPYSSHVRYTGINKNSFPRARR